MNYKSYQEEDIPDKDATPAATTGTTTKLSMTVGNDGKESKSKLKRLQATLGIVAAIVVALIVCVVVVSSQSSLHGIRGIGNVGGDASKFYSKVNKQHEKTKLCPTTGSPLEYSNGGSTQTPGNVYFGLDFHVDSYFGRSPHNPYIFGWYQKYYTKWDQVWQDCASQCNNDDDDFCRSFTVHVYKHGPNEWWGECYFHDVWLTCGGTDIVKKSINKRSIVSGVCTPEDSWDGYNK